MKYIFFTKAGLLLSLFLVSQSAVMAQAEVAVSSVELMQIQSRQFKIADLDKVSSIVQDAFVDMGFRGRMHINTAGQFGKPMPCEGGGRCAMGVGVTLKTTADQQNIIARLSIATSTSTDRSVNKPVTDPSVYEKLFSAIGKSLFLDVQQVNIKELQ